MTVRLINNEQSFCEEIAAIERQCFHEPWSADAVAAFLSFDYNAVLCAFEDTHICGYISYTVVTDELQIANVAVELSHRRKGIAKALLAALHKIAENAGIHKITLDVRVSNTAALNVYTGAGYEIIATHPKFYRYPTEDAYIMAYSPTISERTPQ